MRIMVDTNVLVSAMFFTSEKIDRLFKERVRKVNIQVVDDQIDQK